MNRNVEIFPNDTVAKAAARSIVARAASRIRSWFDGSGLQQESITASTNLEQALLHAAEEFRRDGNVRFNVFVTGQPKPLRADVREHLYNIAREALVNAFRHAQATKIEAEIEYSRRRVRVVVRDNGCGIHPEDVRSGWQTQSGLLRMSEQAKSARAHLQILSRPKGGTEVEISARGAMLDGFSV